MRFKSIIHRLMVVGVVAAIGLLAGCQSFGQPFDSEKIKPGHLLLIPGQGPLHITWEARHLTIAFKGKVDQGILQMDGTIRITGGGIEHFSSLDQLLVQIFFAKADGSVLARHSFYTASRAAIDEALPYTFSRRFELPPGTTHIAFGYDGTVREGGSGIFENKGDAVRHSFQHSPFH